MECEEYYGDDFKAERTSKGIRFALLETISKTGYDKTSENQALAISLSFAGVMCSIVYLLTPTAVIIKAFWYVSCMRVNN